MLWQTEIPDKRIIKGAIEKSSDGNNKMIERISQDWDEDWVNTSKSLYTYDGSSNLTEFLIQWWTNSNWANSSKYSYKYDENNNQTEKIYQLWNGSKWNNIWKYLYTYNGSII